ncbi:glutathione S-transferase [Aestuariispira insulae]|uniref:Glutathione S-transferase n=1 Tax=Aestuariispira insulae TaxID=1461337 RepID=A0A3D9H6Q8_9PROT|nr:glutathione S-transferase [Aestuariispira insulae]RED44831.1 glutathione S-transferase [Aestuariispira insulae]
MTANLLILGNKRYSSWSLRGWLTLRWAEIPFEEAVIPLQKSDTSERILSFGSGYPAKVPTLLKDGHAIWDSLALMEFAAEKAPEKNLWPADAVRRAHARSISAEMHAGFPDLRNEMPMDLGRIGVPKPVSTGAKNDIARILAIWNDCRMAYQDDGPYLFGTLSLADAAFAPVVARFKGYGIETDPVCSTYMEAIWTLPTFQEWRNAAEKEEWILSFD